MTDMTTEEKRFQKALAAVYERAYGEGFQRGLASGLSEKRWLHKAWPLFTLMAGALCMVAGVAIGRAMP